MNKWIGIGRLTDDPSVKESAGDTAVLIARFKLAINRGKDNGADFIPVTAFNKSAEFARDYLKKGVKIAVMGRIATGSYVNAEGVKVYTTEIIAEQFEFCESKNASAEKAPQNAPSADEYGFMNIPEGIDEDLPFAHP